MKNLSTIVKKKCVLGRWSWPQLFLFLVPKEAVFEKSFLGFNFFEFLALVSSVESSNPSLLSRAYHYCIFSEKTLNLFYCFLLFGLFETSWSKTLAEKFIKTKMNGIPYPTKYVTAIDDSLATEN